MLKMRCPHCTGYVAFRKFGEIVVEVHHPRCPWARAK